MGHIRLFFGRETSECGFVGRCWQPEKQYLLSTVVKEKEAVYSAVDYVSWQAVLLSVHYLFKVELNAPSDVCLFYICIEKLCLAVRTDCHFFLKKSYSSLVITSIEYWVSINDKFIWTILKFWIKLRAVIQLQIYLTKCEQTELKCDVHTRVFCV